MLYRLIIFIKSFLTQPWTTLHTIKYTFSSQIKNTCIPKYWKAKVVTATTRSPPADTREANSDRAFANCKCMRAGSQLRHGCSIFMVFNIFRYGSIPKEHLNMLYVRFFYIKLYSKIHSTSYTQQGCSKLINNIYEAYYKWLTNSLAPWITMIDKILTPRHPEYWVWCLYVPTHHPKPCSQPSRIVIQCEKKERSQSPIYIFPNLDKSCRAIFISPW